MRFVQKTCFPSGSLEFWCVLCRGYLCEQHPVKTRGTKSQMSSPDGQHFTRVATIQCWSNSAEPQSLQWERTLEVCTYFLLDFASPPFSLCQFYAISSHCIKSQLPGGSVQLPMQEMQVQSPGREDPLEEEMATHSSILAYKSPWTEEHGGHEVSKSRTQLSD